jgi:hypothetical protein
MKQAVSKAVDKVVGGFRAVSAAVQHKAPEGPSRGGGNIPDIGRVDYSVTVNLSILSGTVGTGGASLGAGNQSPLSAGITADATYTRPGTPPSGPAMVFSQSGGDGLIGGVSLTRAGGQFQSGTVSAGAGVSVPLPGARFLGNAIEHVIQSVGISNTIH